MQGKEKLDPPSIGCHGQQHRWKPDRNIKKVALPIAGRGIRVITYSTARWHVKMHVEIFAIMKRELQEKAVNNGQKNNMQLPCVAGALYPPPCTSRLQNASRASA